MRKQIDLTTLPGWANLSSGNHTIKIKAKGTGYIDSELSAGVVVSKAPSTVTLEKGTYKFVDNPEKPSELIQVNFNFVSNQASFTRFVIGIFGFNNGIYYRVPSEEEVSVKVYNWTSWAAGYQTITLSTAQTVSAEFYKWAITDGNLVKQVEPVAYTDCLTFTGESSEFTLKASSKEWDGTLEWSTDHNTWTALTGTEEMQSVGKKLYLRGKGNTNFFRKNYYGVRWVLSAKAGCSGNIQTLLDWENPPTSINVVTCYANMFYGCANLTSAPELLATTLTVQCYDNMFYGCTNLTTAPELPATTLSDSCYKRMFLDCTNLTTAPKKLPATALEKSCYISMFQGCVNLTTAPELPATTLAQSCYAAMFYDCTKLKINTSSGNKIFTCPSSDNVYNMFTNTGGTFKGTPTAGNTYYWTE